MRILHWLSRHKWIIILSLLLVAILPLSVSAASPTNSEVIAILNAGVTGLVSLVKVAYCASGVTALC